MLVSVCATNYDLADSYGRLAQELAHRLRWVGHDVNYLGSNSPRRKLKPAFNNFLLGYPTLYKNYGFFGQIGRRIAVTMFESSLIPPAWVPILNQLDGVIVPSSWLVNVFKNSGVEVPIYVIPLGISSAFKYKPRRPNPKVISFVAIADRGHRKGADVAGRAFFRAFGESRSVVLRLKARPGAIPGKIVNPNIVAVGKDMSLPQLNGFYGATDFMAFASRGEGFGLPPLEFAATGGVPLATIHGGMADYISKVGLPIRYTDVPAWPENGPDKQNLGTWAEPDVDHLAEMMVYCAENRTRLLRDQAEVAYEVSRKYTWTNFALKCLEVMAGKYGN